MRRSLLVLLLVSGVASADAPQAALRLEGGQPHAGVPFTLVMVIEGFDERPAPALPKIEIPGAKVTPLGAEPNSQHSITIINGQRSETNHVTWVLRWRLEIAKPGPL